MIFCTLLIPKIKLELHMNHNLTPGLPHLTNFHGVSEDYRKFSYHCSGEQKQN